MARRPNWLGQLKISLVSFGIQLFPATTTEKTVSFHEIDRTSGERIHHLNVAGDNEPVEASKIVKGYEYSKGKYLQIEPDEIAKLRIESKSAVEVKQFVDLTELPLELFEKPDFVVSNPRESPEAFAVFRRAMEQTGKAAIGEIAFGGREHLLAVAAPQDGKIPGLMGYILRYEQEMRASAEIFSDAPKTQSQAVDKQQLALAMQLIKNYSRPFNLAAYKDDYEDALRELVAAKRKNAPLPAEERPVRPAKVISLTDALRESLSKAKKPVAAKKPFASERGKVRATSGKGPVLVRPKKRKRRAA
jgi:DNA end-binding protein Ku